MPLSCHSASKLAAICSTCYSLVLLVAVCFVVSKHVVYLLQNKTNMAFAIVSSIVAFSQCGVYCVAIWHYRTYSICKLVKMWYPSYNYYGYTYKTFYWGSICSSPDAKTGTAYYATLIVAMIAQFIISLTAAIYCCKRGGYGCCGNSTGGVSLTYFLLAKVPSLAWEVNSCCIL